MSKKLLLVVVAFFVVMGCQPKKVAKVEEKLPEPVVVAPAPVDTMPSSEAIQGKLQTVHFDFNKYVVRADDGKILEANAKVFAVYPNVSVLIEGNTCDIGTNEYNMALGEKRANAAKDYLVKLGVNAERLSTISYGEEKPVDPAHTEAARVQNRRADFKVK
ncbi:MAG: OmpA family protein [bacterium]|nr:OmpA family protein [bacterium]